jgi:hypothetical protein
MKHWATSSLVSASSMRRRESVGAEDFGSMFQRST